MSRLFKIILNEWYDIDQDGIDIGRFIHQSFFFEQPDDKLCTIADVKKYVTNLSEEINDNFCPCFLTIFKYSFYNNRKKTSILSPCNYTDKTLLNNTEFDENNAMYICFDKQRDCTCGKMEERIELKKCFKIN